MDEDGFTQVKRKTDRRRQGASSGQRAGQGTAQNASQRRGGQNSNRPRANPQSGRGARSAPRDEIKRPGRGRPGGQAPPGPRVQVQDSRVLPGAEPGSSRRGNLQGASANSAHPQSSQGSHFQLEKGSRHPASPGKRPLKQRFVEVAAAVSHVKSDTTGTLSVHSATQTPTSDVEGIASPCAKVRNALPSERAALNGGSSPCTPSAASANTRSLKSAPTSWAAALRGQCSSQVSPRKIPVPQTRPAPVANEVELPPDSGHPKLRVNTEQHLGVRSATPATTAAPSSCSGVAVHDPDTAESNGSVPVECASLVASEATVAGSYSASSFQEFCGFKNPHNMCFAISPLQAALSTEPFRKLMDTLAAVGSLLPDAFEVLRGLAELGKELMEALAEQAVSTQDLRKIVDVFNKLEGFKGSNGDSPFTVARQQPQLDAALLYSTMIDLICEELKKVRKAFPSDDCFLAASQDNSEWKVQTRKGDAAVLGMQHVAGQRCTPFAEAFRGVTASSHRTAHGSSVMLEPFTMLHVRPLQTIKNDTLEAGLARLFERSIDDGPQPGSHQTLILEAPQVLVVQIGRFTYESEIGRTVKVHSPVHHPLTLALEQEWFAPNAPIKRAAYNLVAKVIHKGEAAENGHYITVAKRCEQWIVCDDATVTPALPSEVTQPDAYMLVYEMTSR